ncbi:phosphatidylglycerophosphatase and protein-tyrosine phosphatase 1-like [Argonauta hians]
MTLSKSYILAKMAFYPSLLFNLIMSKISNRNWYDRIDETIILGALPLRHQCKTLIEDERVGGILSANLDHEVKHFTPTEKEWCEMGLRYLRLKVMDFVGTPSPDQVQAAVNFIEQVKSEGRSVYVHCKAGRTRSATLVCCYLIQTKGFDDKSAWDYVVKRRSHARIFDVQRNFLREFYINKDSKEL